MDVSYNYHYNRLTPQNRTKDKFCLSNPEKYLITSTVFDYSVELENKLNEFINEDYTYNLNNPSKIVQFFKNIGFETNPADRRTGHLDSCLDSFTKKVGYDWITTAPCINNNSYIISLKTIFKKQYTRSFKKRLKRNTKNFVKMNILDRELSYQLNEMDNTWGINPAKNSYVCIIDLDYKVTDVDIQKIKDLLELKSIFFIEKSMIDDRSHIYVKLNYCINDEKRKILQNMLRKNVNPHIDIIQSSKAIMRLPGSYKYGIIWTESNNNKKYFEKGQDFIDHVMSYIAVDNDSNDIIISQEESIILNQPWKISRKSRKSIKSTNSTLLPNNTFPCNTYGLKTRNDTMLYYISGTIAFNYRNPHAPISVHDAFDTFISANDGTSKDLKIWAPDYSFKIFENCWNDLIKNFDITERNKSKTSSSLPISEFKNFISNIDNIPVEHMQYVSIIASDIKENLSHIYTKKKRRTEFQNNIEFIVLELFGKIYYNMNIEKERNPLSTMTFKKFKQLRNLYQFEQSWKNELKKELKLSLNISFIIKHVISYLIKNKILKQIKPTEFGRCSNPEYAYSYLYSIVFNFKLSHINNIFNSIYTLVSKIKYYVSISYFLYKYNIEKVFDIFELKNNENIDILHQDFGELLSFP